MQDIFQICFLYNILYVIEKDFVEMHFTTENLYSSSAGAYMCLGRV